MDIEDFFKLDKPIQRIHVPMGASRSRPMPPKKNVYPDSTVPRGGYEYAKDYQKIEEEHYLKNYNTIRENGSVNTLNRLDEISSCGLTEVAIPEKVTEVYEKFNFSKPPPNNLSINLCKNQILQTINASQVTIIRGATGCGKTTQVPQFILDYHYEHKSYCNIIVTQPRKIAAISIAKRVSKERDWPLGELVGYQVGLDAKVNEDTRLQYVTTGVLLQRLIKDQSIIKFTHVIIDEVHERDQDMDFTLLVIRKLLRTNSPYVKIILMSATFDTTKFSQYFATPGKKKLEPAIVIDVPNASAFTVKIFYLDDLKNTPNINEHFTEPYIDPQLLSTTTKLIQAFEEVDFLDFANKMKSETSTSNDQLEAPIGSVLVFLPGIYEIELFFTELQKQVKACKRQWHILPLHSSITCEEQQSVFRSAPKGFRKIILSTNIAESSITVTDVKYVIDFCLSKELETAEGSNFGMLKLIWASKANCNQRAGRVGRVADGRVYRMVTRHNYEKLFRNESKPEMIRAPLARLVLLSKQLNMGTPESILALAMDPPDRANIMKTILQLKEIGGLLVTCDGEVSMVDGDMTLLGHVMASLPLDVHISKLIMLGYLFGCMEECIIMGAALSLKSIFSNPFTERLKSYDSKLTWADGCMSDPIAYLNAYKVWKHSRQQNYFSRSENAEVLWAKRFCLQIKTMNEIAALEMEIKKRLQKMHICSLSGAHGFKWTEGEKKLLYKTVIAGAFYPNYFLRSSHIDETHALKVLGGRNPYNTVYFSGMDSRQPGELYAKQIKKALSQCSEDVKVEFDHSSKIYAVFPSSEDSQHFNKELNLLSSIPGKISISVYKAIKMRHLQMNPVLKVLKYDKSMDLAKQKGIKKQFTFSWETSSNSGPLKSSLPSVVTTNISFKMCHFLNCGHFWVHPTTAKNTLDRIKNILNENEGEKLRKFDNSLKPYVGQVCASFFEGAYYRVRVVECGYYQGEYLYKIFYVDYGNTVLAEMQELRDFGDLTNQMMEFPMLAFEVVLAEVQPSEVCDSGNGWLKEANECFSDMTVDKELKGEVYSVVEGVVSCFVYLNSTNLNLWLIEQKYGQYCEESFQSKQNHEIRQSAVNLTVDQISFYDQEQEAHVNNQDEVEPPNQIDCKYTIKLNGPHSPLEAQIYPLLRATIEKRVTMDPNSVNSVLLSTTPQYGNELLIVAAEISESHKNNSVTLRNTTIMPNIVGLPVLMTMLFCPSLKLFANKSMTKYTKLLCGLGSDEQGVPYFKDHDMELDINVIIDNDDIKYMNKIRCYMGRMLCFPPNILDNPHILTNHLKLGGIAAQNYLKSLWSKNRFVVDNSNCQYEETSWIYSPEYKNNLLTLKVLPNPYMQYFTFHSILKLNTIPLHNTDDLLQHHLELAEKANNAIITPNLECRICEVPLHSVLQLRVHLHSRAHIETIGKLQRA